MTEAQRLWDYYSQKMWNEHSTWDVMDEEAFNKAISDYNPWITDREPTREDGDERGMLEVWDEVARVSRPSFVSTVNGRPFRKIVKPKI